MFISKREVKEMLTSIYQYFTRDKNKIQQLNIPTTLGTIKDGEIIVNCPFCHQNHYHGFLKEGENNGHVIAHCLRGSYIIQLAGGEE